MALIRIQEQDLTPVEHFGGDVFTLRIFASHAFYENTRGIYIASGNIQDASSFYKTYDCSLVDGIIRLPEVELATTTDSSVPTATFTAGLFDVNGVLVYPFLDQFYLDPYYSQSIVASDTLVSLAGTIAARGRYTYRGQHNLKNYYNLENQVDSTENYAIYWDGTKWVMTDFEGTALYKNTSDCDYPWEGCWFLISGAGALPVPLVTEGLLVVATTWEAVTMANQGGYPTALPLNAYPTWPQMKQYVDRFQSPLPWASKYRAGKVYMSCDPAISTNPICVGGNDPTWEALNEGTKYLTEYDCDLQAAIDDIDTTTCELVVTCQCAISANITVPRNILITMAGKGKFTVASGFTLTLSLFRYVASKQYFFGAGNVVFERNAVAEFDLSWWAGTISTSATPVDNTHAFRQIATCFNLNQGGVLHVPAGQWYGSEIFSGDELNQTVIKGVGAGFDGRNIGSTITLFDPDADFLIQAGETFRQFAFQDICLSSGESTTAPAFLGSGDLNTGFRGLFTNCIFRGVGIDDEGTPGVTKFIHTSSNEWEVVGVTFHNCWWQVGNNGIGWRLNTPNSAFAFTGVSTFQCGVQATAMDATGGAGVVSIDNLDARGVAAYDAIYEPERTIAQGSITSGDYVLTLNAATPSNTRFQDDDIGQPVITNNKQYYIRGLDPAGDGLIAYLNTPADTTSTDQPVEVQRWLPYAGTAHAVMITGNIQRWTVNSGADEGFNYSAIVGSTQYFGGMALRNYTVQARIKFVASVNLILEDCQLPSGCLECYQAGADPYIKFRGYVRNQYWINNANIITANPFGYLLSPISIGDEDMFYTQEYYEDAEVDPVPDLRVRKIHYQHTTNTVFKGVATSDEIAAVSIQQPDDVEDQVFLSLDLVYGGYEQYKGIRYSYLVKRIQATGHLNFTGTQLDATTVAADFEMPVATEGLSSTAHIKSSDASGSNVSGIGYTTTGLVTQITSRITAVTLSRLSGQITTDNTSLAAGATAVFTLMNSCILLGDNVILNVAGQDATAPGTAGTLGTGLITATIASIGVGYAQIKVTNTDSVAFTSRLVLNFKVFKGQYA